MNTLFNKKLTLILSVLTLTAMVMITFIMCSDESIFSTFVIQDNTNVSTTASQETATTKDTGTTDESSTTSAQNPITLEISNSNLSDTMTLSSDGTGIELSITVVPAVSTITKTDLSISNGAMITAVDYRGEGLYHITVANLSADQSYTLTFLDTIKTDDEQPVESFSVDFTVINACTTSPIMINEIRGLSGSTMDENEFIELYNHSDTIVDLSADKYVLLVVDATNDTIVHARGLPVTAAGHEYITIGYEMGSPAYDLDFGDPDGKDALPNGPAAVLLYKDRSVVDFEGATWSGDTSCLVDSVIYHSHGTTGAGTLSSTITSSIGDFVTMQCADCSDDYMAAGYSAARVPDGQGWGTERSPTPDTSNGDYAPKAISGMENEYLIGSATLTFSIEFSKPIQDITASDLSINGSPCNATVQSVTKQSDQLYTIGIYGVNSGDYCTFELSESNVLGLDGQPVAEPRYKYISRDDTMLSIENLTPGNLVISEVLVNATDDSKGEWIEIYNTLAQNVRLDGGTIYYADAEQSNATEYVELHGVISTNSYFLLSKGSGNFYDCGTDFGTIVYPDQEGFGSITELNDSSGSVILLKSNPGTAITDSHADILDVASWGLAAATMLAFCEGECFDSVPPECNSVMRTVSGVPVDTESNSSDFQISNTPTPQY